MWRPFVFLLLFLSAIPAYAFTAYDDFQEPTFIAWEGRPISLTQPPVIKGTYAVFGGYAWIKNDVSTPRTGDVYLYNMSNKEIVALSDNKELVYVTTVGFSDDGVVTWNTFTPDTGTHDFAYHIEDFDSGAQPSGQIVVRQTGGWDGIPTHREFDYTPPTATVPEPSSLLLLGGGLLAMFRRRFAS